MFSFGSSAGWQRPVSNTDPGAFEEDEAAPVLVTINTHAHKDNNLVLMGYDVRLSSRLPALMTGTGR